MVYLQKMLDARTLESGSRTAWWQRNTSQPVLSTRLWLIAEPQACAAVTPPFPPLVLRCAQGSLGGRGGDRVPDQ